jgi:hypothetical protein
MLNNKTKNTNVGDTSNAIDGQVNASPNSETDAVMEDQCPYCESNLQCANCGAIKLTDPLIMGENGIYCSMNCKSVEE